MLCVLKGFEIPEFDLVLVWMKTKCFSSPCKRPVQHWLSCISWTQLWSWTAKAWGAEAGKPKSPCHMGALPAARSWSHLPSSCSDVWQRLRELRAALSAGQGTEPDRASQPWPLLISLWLKPHCPASCFDLCKSALSLQSTSDQL